MNKINWTRKAVKQFGKIHKADQAPWPITATATASWSGSTPLTRTLSSKLTPS